MNRSNNINNQPIAAPLPTEQPVSVLQANSTQQPFGLSTVPLSTDQSKHDMSKPNIYVSKNDQNLSNEGDKQTKHGLTSKITGLLHHHKNQDTDSSTHNTGSVAPSTLQGSTLPVQSTTLPVQSTVPSGLGSVTEVKTTPVFTTETKIIPEHQIPVQSTRVIPEQRIQVESVRIIPEKQINVQSVQVIPEQRIPIHEVQIIPEKHIPITLTQVVPEQRMEAGVRKDVQQELTTVTTETKFYESEPRIVGTSIESGGRVTMQTGEYYQNQQHLNQQQPLLNQQQPLLNQQQPLLNNQQPLLNNQQLNNNLNNRSL